MLTVYKAPVQHIVSFPQPSLVALLLRLLLGLALRTTCGNVWKGKAQRVLEVTVAELELLDVAAVAFSPRLEHLQGTCSQVDCSIGGGWQGGALSKAQGELQKADCVRRDAEPKHLGMMW